MSVRRRSTGKADDCASYPSSLPQHLLISGIKCLSQFQATREAYQKVRIGHLFFPCAVAQIDTGHRVMRVDLDERRSFLGAQPMNVFALFSYIDRDDGESLFP